MDKFEKSLNEARQLRDERQLREEIEEIEVAMRDLEDEYSDGLITHEAYIARKAELGFLLASAKM